MSTQAARGAPGRPPALLGPAQSSASSRSRSTVRTRAAAGIALVSWSLAVLGVTMLLLGRPTLDEDVLFLLVDVAVACVYGTVAAVILSRRSHPVPWLLGLAAVGGGLAACGHGYSVWASRPGGPDPSQAVAALQGTAWVPGTLALFLVVPWLVRDSPLGRGARAGLLLGCLVTGATTAAQVAQATGLFVPLMTLVVATGLVTAAGVAVRRRAGPPEERNGLGWLALGTAILALSFVPLLVPAPWLPYWLTPVLHLVSQTVFPAAVLVVVLRNRMWGLRLVVGRAVLAGLLGTILLGTYLATSYLLAALLPGEGIARLIAAGTVVVAVQPARILVGRRVDRLVYGESADPDRVVRRLGSQLVGTASVEELLAGVTEDIGRSMRLESVTVEAAGVPATGWGTPSDLPTVVDLRHRGERVGVLAVSPRPGESLSARDLRTLAELSSMVGAAVAVARAAADVADLRDRLSRVRLEERRVIRREVHDGLGPLLAGVSLGLQGARNLLDTDPESARTLLAGLQEETEAAVAGVRQLSHQLLPPALEELGLVAALRELAGRYAGSGLLVSVEADPVDDLDPEVAASAYGIASEATTNAARHAHAGRCTIRVRREGARLLLSVLDDGVGTPPDAVPGVGTRSMRERAEEQGGTLEVLSGGDGTVVGTEVRATLPLAVARA